MRATRVFQNFEKSNSKTVIQPLNAIIGNTLMTNAKLGQTCAGLPSMAMPMESVQWFNGG